MSTAPTPDKYVRMLGLSGSRVSAVGIELLPTTISKNHPLTPLYSPLLPPILGSLLSPDGKVDCGEQCEVRGWRGGNDREVERGSTKEGANWKGQPFVS